MIAVIVDLSLSARDTLFYSQAMQYFRDKYENRVTFIATCESHSCSTLHYLQAPDVHVINNDEFEPNNLLFPLYSLCSHAIIAGNNRDWWGSFSHQYF